MTAIAERPGRIPLPPEPPADHEPPPREYGRDSRGHQHRDPLPEVDDTVDVAAERACLGAALHSADIALQLAEIVHPGDWSQHRHATIAAVTQALAEAGRPVEPATVLAELQHRGDLVRVGGGAYLHTLDAATSPAWAHHARDVAHRAHLRRIAAAGLRMHQQATAGQADVDQVDEILDRTRAELDAVADRRRGRNVFEFADLLNAAVDSYGDEIPPGLATPWPDLDDILGGGGLRPGALTVIGARPGVGKSVLGANLARYAAAGGASVLLASLEMPATELMDRLISAEASVHYERIRDHKLTESDWQAIDRAADRLRGHTIRIDDNPAGSLATIRSTAREMTRTSRLGLVVIDYLQLLKPADTRVPRQEQVATMARGCKLLARELDVPVVALAQLNRGPSGRASSRPTMTDLRESGEIENSADQIILLHREDPIPPGEIELNVVKNRAGRTGSTSLSWAGHYQRAASLSRRLGLA
ncbi:MAG TPA: DnaB-like helicase C-terminal domain-containing protein [Pseudonocardiaceae bacterium]